MKRLPFLLVLFCFTHCYSQIEKNDLIIGGTLTGSIGTNKSSSQSYDQKIISIKINPKLGYFIKNNFCMGGSVFGNYRKVKNKSSISSINEITDKNLNVGPFLRYYLLMLKSKFAVPFVEISGTFGISRSIHTGSYSLTTNIPFKAYYDAYNLNYNIGAGVDLFVKKDIAIEFMGEFNYFSFKSETTGKDLAGNLYYKSAKTNSLNFLIGLQYFF